MKQGKFKLKSLLGLRILGAVIILFSIALISWRVSSINEFVGIPNSVGQVAGFWAGLWDGICSPATSIWNGLSIDEKVYNSHNCGFFYPFAFLIPVSVFMYLLIMRRIIKSSDI